jgi:hypothetical protein
MCTYLVAGALLALRHPHDVRFANGVETFYLGIRVIGFPLGTVAFYVAYAVVSAGVSSVVRVWIYGTVVLVSGGVQWLVIVPQSLRLLSRWVRGTTMTSILN